MAELEERLQAVLSDPQQMEKIAAMASKLMGSMAPEEKNAPPPDSALMGMVSRVAAGLGGGGKGKLMAGLGPYLAESRRRRLERALRIASAAGVAAAMLDGMGGPGDDPL